MDSQSLQEQYTPKVQIKNMQRQDEAMQNAMAYREQFPEYQAASGAGANPILEREQQRVMQLNDLDMLEEQLDHPELVLTPTISDKQISAPPKKMGYFEKKSRRSKLSKTRKLVDKNTRVIQETRIRNSIAEQKGENKDVIAKGEIKIMTSEYELKLNMLLCRGLTQNSEEVTKLNQNYNQTISQKYAEMSKLYAPGSKEAVEYEKQAAAYLQKIQGNKQQEKKVSAAPQSKTVTKQESNQGAPANKTAENTAFAHLSKDEVNAIIDYTGPGYKRVNKALRAQDMSQLDEKHSIIHKNLTNALEKSQLKEDMTVYRGTTVAALGGLAKYIRMEEPEELVGKVLTERAFMSTTTDKSVATGTYLSEGAIILNIKAPQGTKALDVSGESQFKDEKEMLFQSGQRMVVERVKQEDGIFNLYVTIDSEKEDHEGDNYNPDNDD